MKRFVKILRACVIAIVTIAAIGWGLIRYLGSSNSQSLKYWIGGQLQTVANWYLNPKLTFEYLDYQYPQTIVLTKLKLTADDPREPGKTIDVIAAEKITLQLAKLPRVGEPLMIEKIVLDHPEIHAVADGPKSRTFVGLSNLVKQDEQKQREFPQQPAGTKLSDVFQIRLLQMIDGKISYDPRTDSGDAMELDHINSRMDVSKTPDGWYKLSAEVGRAPVFAVNIGGELNLDSFSARAMNMNLTATVDEAGNKSLPPSIQKLIQQYEITGKLHAVLSGQILNRDLSQSDLKGEIGLTNGHAAIGEYQIPIKQLAVPMVLKDSVLSIDSLSLSTMDGTITGGGTMRLDESRNCSLQLSAIDVMLERLMRKEQEKGRPMKLAGRVTASLGFVDAPLTRVFAAMTPPASQPVLLPRSTTVLLPAVWGSGRIKIDHGELGNIPGLSHVFAAVSKSAVSLSGRSSDKYQPTDTAEAEFLFTGDFVQVKRVIVSKSVIAIVGSGKIGLNKNLDMTLSLTPPEKVDTLFANTIGQLTGAIAQRMMSVKVTGSMSEPEVKISPFNFAGVPGDDTPAPKPREPIRDLPRTPESSANDAMRRAEQMGR